MINTIAYIALDQWLMAEKQLISVFAPFEPLASIFNKFVEAKAELTQSIAKQTIDAFVDFSKQFPTFEV